MPFKRGWVLCLVVLLITGLLPLPAHAQEPTPSVSASPGSIEAGQSVTITISGFNPGNPVHVHIVGPGGASLWSDMSYDMPINGNSIYFALPTLSSDPVGTYIVQVDDGWGGVSSANFNVTGGSSPPPPPPDPGSPPVSEPSAPANPSAPAAPNAPAAPSAPEPPPFTLPITNECLVAGRGDSGVNVRSIPSTDGALVGSLAPATAYTVVGVASMSDGVWYEINDGGWVASFVTQHAGPCDSLPNTYTPDAPANSPAQPQNNAPSETTTTAAGPKLLKYTVNMRRSLSTCPQIEDEAMELPIHVQLDIMTLDNGCDYTQSILTEAVFGFAPSMTMTDINDILMAECPGELPAFAEFTDELWNFNRGLFEQVENSFTRETACSQARDLRNGRIPPELWNGNLNTAVQLSAMACLDVDAARILTAMQKAQEMMLDPVGVAVDCHQIEILNEMGTSLPATYVLLEEALRACGYDNPLSIHQIKWGALYANTDISRMLREIDFNTFCHNPIEAIDTYGDYESAFDGLSQFAGCPYFANVLSSFGPEMSDGELYSILHSADPCEAALQFIEQGSVPLVDNLPACYNHQTGHFERNGEVIVNHWWRTPEDEYRAWSDSALILQQDQICSSTGGPPPVAPDEDWDYVPDDADACPSEPGAGLDGCPIPFGPGSGGEAAPAPANANAVLLWQADVFMAPGETRMVRYAPQEYTGVPTNIFVANSADPNVVQAMLENGQLKLTGVNPGKTQVTIFFTNGAATESVIFSVEVAANALPSVQAIADQTITVGSNVTLPVRFDNAAGALLVMAAQSSAPDVALAFVAVAPQVIHEGFINLVGVTPGSATIMVSIVAMGNTPMTATTTFTLNVVEAGSAPAAEPPLLKPISDQTLPAQTKLTLGRIEGATPAPLGDLVAASANPQVVTAQVINAELVLTGIAPGVAMVTLVAHNGAGSSSVAFNVTVTPSNIVPADQPAAPTELVLDQDLVNGLPDVLLGVIDLPEGMPQFSTLGSLGEAVFQSGTNQAYRLAQAEPVLLRDNAHYPVMNPTRPLVAYLSDDLMLWILDVEQGVAAPVDVPWPVEDYPPVWSPDGTKLFYTLSDGIYLYPIDEPPGGPQRAIPGGYAPAISPNGRYMAFRMIAAEQDGIFVAAMPNLAEMRPILEEGSSCHGPQFSTDSLSLYFTCDTDSGPAMYRVGIRGVEPLNVGIPGAQNPAPGPVAGFFAFDDGTRIYLASDDLSQVAPLLQIPGNPLSRMRWRSASAEN